MKKIFSKQTWKIAGITYLVVGIPILFGYSGILKGGIINRHRWCAIYLFFNLCTFPCYGNW